MKTFKKAEERRRSYLGEQLIIGRNDFPLSLSLSLEIVFREKSKLQCLQLNLIRYCFPERAFPMIVFWKWIQLHCLPKEMQRNTQVNEENFTRSSQTFWTTFLFSTAFRKRGTY